MRRDGLRILMVADVSPLQRAGGSARAIREQTLGLSRRGHSLTVVCRHPGGEVPIDSQLENARVHHYGVARNNPLAYAVTSLYGAKRAYRHLFRRQMWDTVIFHQPFSAVGIRPMLPSSQTCLYYFYSPAGVEYQLRATQPRTGRCGLGAKIISVLLKRLEKRALQKVNRVVVLSRFSRDLLEDQHGRSSPQVVLIPGGVDLDHFQPSSDRDKTRRELSIPTNTSFLLTIRDLEQRMGIDTLLDALPSVKTDTPFSCAIGGSGPLRAYLEERASRSAAKGMVRFLGHIPEEQLPLYYQAADVFVLPTQAHEGFGLVTVEALACGTPVVATPVGATPEILKPLDEKLLASDSSARSLAHSISRALPLGKDTAYRERCRRYTEKYFSWENHVERLEQEIATLLRMSSHPHPIQEDSPPVHENRNGLS